MKPLVEIWAGKNMFTGAQLVPERKKSYPYKYQYSTYSSDVAKVVGNMVGDIPVVGDTPLASPIILDHFVRAWTAGVGRLALDTVGYGMEKTGVYKAVPKPARTLADIPLLRAVFARYPSADTQPIRAFFENAAKFKGKNLLIKQEGTVMALQGRKDDLNELVSAYGNDAAIRMDKVRMAVNNNLKFVEYIHQHPTMPPEQKREMIDKTYNNLINFTRQVNEALDRVRTGQKPRQK